MRTLALIPARAGSKSVPGKNTRDFCGKPLLMWAVDVGKVACEQTWVTSDDPAALEIARFNGANAAPRPVDLAADDTPMLPVVQHAVRCITFKPDVVVLLQPTQPLRQPKHVRAALNMLRDNPEADSVVSVVRIPEHYSPDFAMRISQDGLVPFNDPMPTRRQDCRPAYSRDGTVYAIRRETIEKGSLYGDHCMPLVIPSGESCNIDTEEDWQRAEALHGQR